MNSSTRLPSIGVDFTENGTTGLCRARRLSYSTYFCKHTYLLLTHLVGADRQIHSEEAKTLRELAEEAKIKQNTLVEMEKILSHEENYLVLEDVAAKVPLEQQSETMRQVIAIAYTDGFFAPLEKEFVKKIAQIWKWSPKEIDKILEDAEGFKPKLSNNEQEYWLPLVEIYQDGCIVFPSF
jgi:uncharacterized tellurite resistance protein B-like protein